MMIITLVLLLALEMVLSASVWPGLNNVTVVDKQNEFNENLSGLYYKSSNLMYAVMNQPSMLFKLYFNDGKYWISTSEDGWSNGKAIKYKNGNGSPDSEDLTMDSNGSIFVCSERDNNNSGKSKIVILQYMIQDSDSSTSLTAHQQWDITSDLPVSDKNEGTEGITYVSDSYLQSKGFIDESTNKEYNPDNYDDHFDGVFFVGLESNGYIYGYIVQSNGKYSRISTFSSGEKTIMSLSFDTTTGNLWSGCDNNCDGRRSVFKIKNGSFYKDITYERRSSMGNLINEGNTISIEITNAYKSVFFADDDNDDGHSIRTDKIPCNT